MNTFEAVGLLGPQRQNTVITQNNSSNEMALFALVLVHTVGYRIEERPLAWGT